MLSGYSFKSSQYGLMVDNVAGYELVLPNGTITTVTSKNDDLWFGLRVSTRTRYRFEALSIYNQSQGGVNNFVRHWFLARAIFMGC
jgi:FAD/FMN-containing dehydrogenase